MATQANVQLVTVPQPIFDEYHPKYKCCCSCCHVKVGTLILGVLTAIGILFAPYALIVRAASIEPLSNEYNVSATFLEVGMYGAVAVYAFEAIAVVCLFVGLAKEYASLLLPYTVLIGIRMVGQFVCAIIFVVLACLGKKMQEFVTNVIIKSGGDTHLTPEQMDMIRSAATAVCVSVAIAFVIGGFIEMWFFTVVRACGRYFQDKQAFYFKGTIEGGDAQGQQGFNYARMQ